MAKLRLFYIIVEFWVVIVAFAPILLSLGWFTFKSYLITQNDFLAKYQPTINAISVMVAVASVIIGYLTLMNEIHKLKEQNKPESAPSQNNIKMQTIPTTSVNMRECPIPSDSQCQVITVLLPKTIIEVLAEKKPYVDSKTGKKSIWQKVHYKSHDGWINDSLLVEYLDQQ